MSIRKIKEAFNAIIKAAGMVCVTAELGMAKEPAGGKEWQRLRFRGKRADGSDFELVKLVPAEAEIINATRQIAGEFIGASP